MKRLLTIAEFAERNGVRRGTVYKWIARGVLTTATGLVKLPSGSPRIDVTKWDAAVEALSTSA